MNNIMAGLLISTTNFVKFFSMKANNQTLTLCCCSPELLGEPLFG